MVIRRKVSNQRGRYCVNSIVGIIFPSIEMQEIGTVTPPENKSIEQCSHSHPFEYLTKLNHVFNAYNRSTVKDYSSASKIKLPFYKFNTIKVPQIFEDNYAKQKKQLVHYNTIQPGKLEEGDRKLWRQHRQIIQNYLAHKKAQPIKHQKNATNKEFVQKILAKDRNNIFLKKIVEKGTTFDYDQEKLEQEVIQKLKNLHGSTRKKMNRCQTAKCLSSQVKVARTDEVLLDVSKDKISSSDYLQCEQQQEMIVKYKAIIKKADFSISDKNINSTSELLARMKKMASENTYY